MSTTDGKRNRCWQWLESEKPITDSLPMLKGLPISMLDTREDAEIVLAHAKAYAEYYKLKE